MKRNKRPLPNELTCYSFKNRDDLDEIIMWIKRILILLPLGITMFLVQSFFWVPTYEKQAKGNPDRLIRYIYSSIGDAQILNPILSADTASSDIISLVFDGLIDLDENLNYRPRLASGWTQHEEAYLAIDPEFEREGRA
ncbi:MAG: hypothetical protein ACE5EK_05425, partial [Nitrospinales bacterium]